MNKIISFIFLFFLSILNASEKKFPHAAGEYDLNGLELLKMVHSTISDQQIKKELDDFITASKLGRHARHNAQNCTIRDFAFHNSDKYKNINNLYKRMQTAQGFIDWKPYLTGNFVYNEKILLHKLADLCDQDKDNELLVLIKTIDELSGPNYTIESSYKNAFGTNNETGQPVCFDLIGGGPNGHGMSVLFKNKNGQTPLDISKEKLEIGYFLGVMLKSSCIPCRELNNRFQELSQTQTTLQNYLDFILKEEKNLSLIPVQMSNNDTFKAYKQCGIEWGLSQEQLDKIIQLQQHFHNSSQLNLKTIHDRRFPISMMKKILRRNNLNINNFNLIVFNDAMADNGEVLYNPYAVSSINHSDMINHKKITLNIGVYPQFFTLSPAEQEAVLIQQIEHLNQLKIYSRNFFLRAISHKNKVPISRIANSKSFRKYQQMLEKETIIIPASQHKDVAALFNRICSSHQNRIFSQQNCDLLKEIEALYKTKN